MRNYRFQDLQEDLRRTHLGMDMSADQIEDIALIMYFENVCPGCATKVWLQKKFGNDLRARKGLPKDGHCKFEDRVG